MTAMSNPPPTTLGARFAEALTFAASIHADQRCKGTQIPYIAHVLGVASLALEYGADEDEAIAALLHDTN
jgi:(p)ppGpp synthase/HD superfamily hydrolase